MIKDILRPAHLKVTVFAYSRPSTLKQFGDMNLIWGYKYTNTKPIL